jgi:Mce-associated membrane protein
VVVARAYDEVMHADPLGGRRRAVAIVALVVAVVVAALAALGARQLSDTKRASSDRAAALGAARQIAVDFAAYDYHHLNEDFQRVAGESTGSFRQQYLTQSAGVQSLIVKAKAVSTAEVVSGGVVEGSGSRATIVLALNRTVTNTSVPKGQNDSFGLQMVMLRLHGRWLASDVKPL